jgi:uncharacterized membrane protein YfcA
MEWSRIGKAMALGCIIGTLLGVLTVHVSTKGQIFLLSVYITTMVAGLFTAAYELRQSRKEITASRKLLQETARECGLKEPPSSPPVVH